MRHFRCVFVATIFLLACKSKAAEPEDAREKTEAAAVDSTFAPPAERPCLSSRSGWEHVSTLYTQLGSQKVWLAHGRERALPPRPCAIVAIGESVVIALVGRIGVERRTEAAETIVVHDLALTPGVRGAYLVNGRRPAYFVDTDDTRLPSMGASLADVRATLATTNVHRPAGQLDDARRNFMLATEDEDGDVAQVLLETRVGQSGAKLGDVATIERGSEVVQSDPPASSPDAVRVAVALSPSLAKDPKASLGPALARIGPSLGHDVRLQVE